MVALAGPRPASEKIRRVLTGTSVANILIVLKAVSEHRYASLAVFPCGLGKFEMLRAIAGVSPSCRGCHRFGPLGATSIVNHWVVCYQMRAGQSLPSENLLADASHTRADVVTTVAIIGDKAVALPGQIDPC